MIFRSTWIDQISKYQKDIIPVDEVEKHKVWFEYLFNEKQPASSTFRCRLCTKYYDAFGLQQRYKSVLANEKGTLKKYKHDNKKAIAEHANNPGHTTVIQTLQDQSAKRLFSHQLLEIFEMFK